jgi:hypothetical protein
MKACSARSEWVKKEIQTKKYSLVISAEWPGTVNYAYQRQYFNTIQESVDSLIIFQTNPRVAAAKDCVSSTYTYDVTCVKISPKLIPNMISSASALRSLQSSKTHIIESQNWICLKEICPITADGTFVLRDGSHITYSYLKKISPLINATLDSISSWASN